MDPNRIIQALKGTIDPKLRIAAENELNQVRGADAAEQRDVCLGPLVLLPTLPLLSPPSAAELRESLSS
uniref:Uncharacterized protein n=1 Tax=Pavo cristatus TaxID=9049 RepID=A0A8C9G031_PAVCR